MEKAEQFQNTQAIELFKKAIEFDPKFAMAYARIGYAYAVQDFQPEKARPYLDHALHLSERLPAINRLHIEAWSAIARSDYNAAIGILRHITELLSNAIQKNPDAKDLYNAFGMILISMGRSQDAIGAYRQCVALARRSAPGGSQRCIEQGRYRSPTYRSRSLPPTDSLR